MAFTIKIITVEDLNANTEAAAVWRKAIVDISALSYYAPAEKVDIAQYPSHAILHLLIDEEKKETDADYVLGYNLFVPADLQLEDQRLLFVKNGPIAIHPDHRGKLVHGKKFVDLSTYVYCSEILNQQDSPYANRYFMINAANMRFAQVAEALPDQPQLSRDALNALLQIGARATYPQHVDTTEFRLGEKITTNFIPRKKLADGTYDSRQIKSGNYVGVAIPYIVPFTQANLFTVSGLMEKHAASHISDEDFNEDALQQPALTVGHAAEHSSSSEDLSSSSSSVTDETSIRDRPSSPRQSSPSRAAVSLFNPAANSANSHPRVYGWN